MLDESYTERIFTQKSVQIPSILIEPTFLEKIFMLHEEFQHPKE